MIPTRHTRNRKNHKTQRNHARAQFPRQSHYELCHRRFQKPPRKRSQDASFRRSSNQPKEQDRTHLGSNDGHETERRHPQPTMAKARRSRIRSTNPWKTGWQQRHRKGNARDCAPSPQDSIPWQTRTMAKIKHCLNTTEFKTSDNEEDSPATKTHLEL